MQKNMNKSDKIKQQIIYENNIYILRYMGGDVNSDGIVIKDGEDMPFPTTGYRANGFLLYDCDYEWIMPVVEKMERENPDINFVIYDRIVQMNGEEFIGETKLEAIYKAACYFIYDYFQTLN